MMDDIPRQQASNAGLRRARRRSDPGNNLPPNSLNILHYINQNFQLHFSVRCSQGTKDELHGRLKCI